MTLILTCLTDDLVVQACDRRLTVLGGERDGELLEDERNKSVIFCRSAVFAYTGMARIGGRFGLRTDLWLAGILRGYGPGELQAASEGIRIAATATVNALPPDVDIIARRHAFVSVGWARFDEKRAPRPFWLTISNAVDDQGNWRETAEASFGIQVRPLNADEPFRIDAAGQRLPQRERIRLERGIRRCLARNLTPAAYARLLVATIRAVAAGNGRVGKNVIVTTIPIAAATSMNPMLWVLSSTIGEMDRSNVMYRHFLAQSKSAINPGPIFVCRGNVIYRYGIGPGPAPTHTCMEPPWLEQAIVLSGRRQIICGITGDQPENVAILREEYAIKNWALLAGVGNNPPGPCMIALRKDPSTFASIKSDSRFLVLIENAEEAADSVDRDWLERLRSWLHLEKILPAVTTPVIASMNGRQKGEIVFELKRVFANLEWRPDEGPKE